MPVSKEFVGLIENKPDITLEEIRVHFKKNCTLNTISVNVRKLGFVYKKTLRASEQDREDIKQKRSEWKNIPPKLAESRLLFLDETRAKTNVTRRYGRSYYGLCCYDYSPDGRRERTSILSGLIDDGKTFSLILKVRLIGNYTTYI